MKLLLLLLFSSVALTAMAQQTYNPTKGTASNKPYAPSQGVPTDSRSYFYDSINFVWRPYVSTTEVKSYLNLSKYRVGQFDIIVNTGGTLSSGVITGGTNALWYFKNGTADSNLVPKVTAIDTTTRFGGVASLYKVYKDSLVLATSTTVVRDSLSYYLKLQTQNPTASITGGFDYQRLPSGSNLSVKVYWTIGRAAATSVALATANISSVFVDFTSRGFTNPAAGATYSDSTTLSIPRNTNKNILFNVLTSDSKSAASSTQVNVYDKRYIGWATTATPSDAEILAAINQDNSGGTVAYSTTLAQLGSARYLFYANTAQCSSITVNGFLSTSAFALNVSRSFTNSDGGVATYYVTTSNNAIGATSTTTLTVN